MPSMIITYKSTVDLSTCSQESMQFTRVSSTLPPPHRLTSHITDQVGLWHCRWIGGLVELSVIPLRPPTVSLSKKHCLSFFTKLTTGYNFSFSSYHVAIPVSVLTWVTLLWRWYQTFWLLGATTGMIPCTYLAVQDLQPTTTTTPTGHIVQTTH